MDNFNKNNFNKNNFNILQNSDDDEDDESNKDICENIEDLIETLSDFENNESQNEKKYMDPIILENINLEKYFSKEDIFIAKKNNKKLQITDKGLYSISKHNDALWITNIIVSFVKNNLILSNSDYSNNISIIDSTAGIGGNTINFSKYFSKVYAIEINNTHYNVLNNNIVSLNIKNIETYNNNFLHIIDNFKNNSIFFIDPPWGGKNYKNFKFFNLKIGKLPIYLIINTLFDKKYKCVVLKAPYNLNISPLIPHVKYENLNIHKNAKKNMILLIFY